MLVFLDKIMYTFASFLYTVQLEMNKAVLHIRENFHLSSFALQEVVTTSFWCIRTVKIVCFCDNVPQHDYLHSDIQLDVI
jgi:hypothetical protein